MPSKQQLEKALALVQRRSDYEFFFENLKSADWLPHLVEKKIFEKPDGPIPKDKNMMQFPIWPASRYLVRIAGEASDEVLKVILSVPETENPRIHYDFVEAALKMPPRVAVKLTKKAINWLKNPYQLLYYRQVVALIGHLKSGGYAKEAFELTDAVLSIKESRRTNEQKKEELSYEKAKPIIGGDWEYGECLKEIAPLFIGEEKFKFILLLCNKLADVVSVEERITHRLDFVDYSHIWRGSIEGSNQNHNFGIKDDLIDWIRDLAEELAASDSAMAGDLIGELRAKEAPLFSRFVIHLVRNFDFGKLTNEILLDYKLFQAMDTWHEYSLLLQEKFSSLNSQDRRKILDMIYAYSPLKPNEGEQHLSKDQDTMQRQMRYHYLYLIKEQLEGEDKKKVDELEIEFGEVKNPTFSSYSEGGWVGPISPVSLVDMEALTTDQLKDYLLTWKPENKFGPTPTKEGLGRELQQFVAKDPEKFLTAIEQFKIPEKIYVQSIIDGFGDACSAGIILNWEIVISYLKWAIGQSCSESGELIEEEFPGSWTRLSACRLIQKALNKDDSPIDFNSAADIWEIIQVSLSDKDPSKEREEKFAEDRNYYHIAINSTRGEAIEVSIQFVLWLKKNLKNAGKEFSKDDFPEVMNAIAFHSDPSNDSSKAVHSVYGRWLPWLMTLDGKWFDSIISNILSTDNEYWTVAWRAYIMYCQPFDDIFKKIESQYGRALSVLETEKENTVERFDKKLVEHITVFYLRHLLDLESSLFKLMYEKADLSLRSWVIEYIGRGLSSERKDLNPDLIEQAKELWLYRVEACRKMSTVEERRELADFGWWMGTKHLPDEWLLDQVIETVQLCRQITPDFAFMGRLVSMVNTYPVKVAKVMELLVDYQVSDYGGYIFLDKAAIILKKLRKTEAAQSATDTINKLGAFGFSRFEELLQD